PDLASPGALRAVPLQRPAQPRLRELVRPLPRLLPAALDDARLRGDVEHGLARRQGLRVVHRHPRLRLRPRLLHAGQPAPRSHGVAPSPLLSDRYTDYMAKQVTATEAKAMILRLLDDAAAGEEIEITRHGRPVARLVPASGARSLKGSFDGVAVTAVEEEQLFSTGEAWDAS